MADDVIVIENTEDGSVVVTTLPPTYAVVNVAAGITEVIQPGDTSVVEVVVGAATAGSDGKTVLSGHGAPSSGIGKVGDFYIDVDAWEIYGPKVTGSWGDPTDMVGPQGEPGEPGATGSPGTPVGSDTAIQFNNAGAFAGSDDFEWDDTDKVLYVNGNISQVLPDGGDPMDTTTDGNEFSRYQLQQLNDGDNAGAGSLFINDVGDVLQFYQGSTGNFAAPRGVLFRSTGPGVLNIVSDTGSIAFGKNQIAGGDEFARFTNDGKFGLGIQEPDEVLHVVGNAKITDLAGTGTRMVTTDGDGVLGQQDIPAEGLDGTAVLNGTGAPPGGTGVDGDFYIDTTALAIYGPKTSGAWGSGVPLVGPQGDAGATGDPGSTGSPGADGNAVRNGSGAPDSGTGVDGDFYIDTSGNNLYGPKTSGSWGSPTGLVGPQGEPGDTGDTGPAGGFEQSTTLALSDVSTDFLGHIQVNDDGSASGSWPDRFAFYYKPSGGSYALTGYHNEFGELRARPAKATTTPLRVLTFAPTGGSTANLFEVCTGDQTTQMFFYVSAMEAEFTVPVSAPNIGAKVTVSGSEPSSPSTGDVWVDTST